MKWIPIGLVVLAVLVAVWAVFVFAVGNPHVVAQLREAPHGKRAHKVMLLTLPTGAYVPVNYLREGDTVYAGADGRWWRALRGDGAPVTLLIRGETLQGHATAIESDPARTREVFARLRPNVPAWLPGWLDAVLVAIELDPSAAETR